MTKVQIHTAISYVKSVLRLVGYAIVGVATWHRQPLAALGMAVLFKAELLGIAEEIWGS